MLNSPVGSLHLLLVSCVICGHQNTTTGYPYLLQMFIIFQDLFSLGIGGASYISNKITAWTPYFAFSTSPLKLTLQILSEYCLTLGHHGLINHNETPLEAFWQHFNNGKIQKLWFLFTKPSKIFSKIT